MKKQIIVCMGLMFLSTFLFGQVSVISNNSSTSTDFVGWNSVPTFDLDLKHEGDYRMVFATNNTDRFGILSTANNSRVVLRNALPIDDAKLTIKATFAANINSAVRSVGIPVTLSTAGFFNAFGAPNNAGLRGTASNAAAQFNYGVAGYSCNTGTARSFAVYGILKEGCSGWAGYFNGNTFTPGAAWTSSDLSLKTNIEPLTNGMSKLEALTPKSYEFDQSFDRLRLPEGIQYGVMAQELATVIPHAVQDVEGANIDEEGTYSFKAVNNQQLIPVLILAFQERQAELDQQQELIAQLEEAIEAAEIQMSQINAE
jgi:hypothetical protein